jgi:DNA-damage-inducible protein J
MTTVNIRIDSKTKKAAMKTFSELGLDLSTGIKMFLNQVIVEQGLPFTPSRNPAALRTRWNNAVGDALKSGRAYRSGRDALKDL